MAFAGGDDAAGFGQFEEDHVAEGFLGVVGDADGELPSVGADPFVGGGVAQIGGGRHGISWLVNWNGKAAAMRRAHQIRVCRWRTKEALTTLALRRLPRMSDLRRLSPGATSRGRRARAMDFLRVGEKVPLVVSPSPWAVKTCWWRAARLCLRAPGRAPGWLAGWRRAALPTKSRLGVLEIDRPGEAGVERRDGLVHVVAVEAMPASEAQGVAGTEAAGLDAGGDEGVPGGGGRFGRQGDFEAVFAGVAGAGDEMVAEGGGLEDLEVGQGGFGTGDGRPGLGAGVRALDGDHRQIAAGVRRAARPVAARRSLHPGHILVGGAGIDDHPVFGVGGK